ncbi:MAG TPA: DNA-binding domain-containing protein [Polyangiaceae bacterium]|nr:DNA-binding domain-containing protein [Polyangiaceae bacterium]
MRSLDGALHWLTTQVQSPRQLGEPSEAERWIGASARLTAAAQVEIYREQYWLRHIEALREDFPGLVAVLGDDTFAHLAERYLVAHPPQSPTLRDLGHALVSYLEQRLLQPELLLQQELVLPHAPLCLDMARLEWAYVECFDAAEAPPFDLASLERLGADAWAELRLQFSPALRWFEAHYPVADLRRALLAGEPFVPPEPHYEWRAVYRDAEGLLWDRPLPEAAARLLGQLAANEALGKACENVVAELPAAAEAFDRELGDWFASFGRLGWIVGAEAPAIRPS